MSSELLRIHRPRVIDDVLDGEAVIINLENGVYYSLDGAGTDVWEILADGATRGQVVTELAARYRRAADEIESDVERLIEELVAEELVVAAPGASSPGADAPAGEIGPSAGPDYVPPRLNKFTDMQELLLLDPVHEVDDAGWPTVPAKRD